MAEFSKEKSTVVFCIPKDRKTLGAKSLKVCIQQFFVPMATDSHVLPYEFNRIIYAELQKREGHQTASRMLTDDNTNGTYMYAY